MTLIEETAKILRGLGLAPDLITEIQEALGGLGFSPDTVNQLKSKHMVSAGVPELLADTVVERIREACGLNLTGPGAHLALAFAKNSTQAARKTAVDAVVALVNTEMCLVMVEGKPNLVQTTALVAEMVEYKVTPPTWEGQPIISLRELHVTAKHTRRHDPITNEMLSPQHFNNRTLVSWADMSDQVLALVHYAVSKGIGTVSTDFGASFTEAFRRDDDTLPGWYDVVSAAFDTLSQEVKTSHLAAIRYDPKRSNTARVPMCYGSEDGTAKSLEALTGKVDETFPRV